MLFFTICKVSLKSLIGNKLRSFLAMLGIIIGVSAVIAMLSLGTGARKKVMERLSAMGSNLLIVRPGQRGSRGVMSGTFQNLTLEDSQAIIEKVSEVDQVAPLVRSSTQMKYFNANTRANVIGTSITYLPIRNFQVEQGRAFTEQEVERGARVVLLGTAVLESLFGHNNPLGETIKVKGINFLVIGVLKSKGDQGWYNPDNQILVPYPVAMKQLFGTSSLNEISVQVREGKDIEQAMKKIARLVRRNHRIEEGQPDDFYIRNMAEIQETYASVSKTFTVLLGGIAYISLLVGGIGIMNIMLVTVTERTREIGIRKAVGAREKDILLQFIVEAVFLCGVGGVLGVGCGVGISRVISNLSDFTCIVTGSSVVLALSFSAAVGIFFGYYPARCAARLDPIDALRYE